jgi:hypothetical protein
VVIVWDVCMPWWGISFLLLWLERTSFHGLSFLYSCCFNSSLYSICNRNLKEKSKAHTAKSIFTSTLFSNLSLEMLVSYRVYKILSRSYSRRKRKHISTLSSKGIIYEK